MAGRRLCVSRAHGCRRGRSRSTGRFLCFSVSGSARPCTRLATFRVRTKQPRTSRVLQRPSPSPPPPPRVRTKQPRMDESGRPPTMASGSATSPRNPPSCGRRAHHRRCRRSCHPGRRSRRSLSRCRSLCWSRSRRCDESPHRRDRLGVASCAK